MNNPVHTYSYTFTYIFITYNYLRDFSAQNDILNTSQLMGVTFKTRGRFASWKSLRCLLNGTLGGRQALVSAGKETTILWIETHSLGTVPPELPWLCKINFNFTKSKKFTSFCDLMMWELIFRPHQILFE